MESLLFALLFCGYPVVSFLPDFIALPDRSASIGFRGLCLVLGISVIFRNRRNLMSSGAGIWLIFGFWIIYLCRTIYDYTFVAGSVSLGLNEYLAYTYGISFNGMLAMFVVRDWRKLQYAPLITMLLCAATCVLAATYGVTNYDVEMGGRVMGNQRLNPITLGHTGTTLIVSSLWYIFRRRQLVSSLGNQTLQMQIGKVAPLWFKILAAARLPFAVCCLPLGFYALVLSASRSPSVALIVCLGIIAIWLRGRVVYLSMLGFAAAAAFIQLGFLAQILNLGVDVDRVSTVGLGSDDFAGGRMDLFGEAWERFLSSPVYGRSLFLSNGAYPHNLVLEALMATGLLGGIILLAILFRSFLNLQRLIKGDDIVFWLVVLYVQAFTSTMTSGSIFYDPMTWSILGVGLGLATVPRPLWFVPLDTRMRPMGGTVRRPAGISVL